MENNDEVPVSQRKKEHLMEIIAQFNLCLLKNHHLYNKLLQLLISIQTTKIGLNCSIILKP
jgi:hypothetical protein